MKSLVRTADACVAATVELERLRAAALLLLGSPSEILARLLPEDPLGLRARVAARLESRALLLDAERVLLRVQAALALSATGWRGTPRLERWLDEHVEAAFAELVGEDGGGEGGGEDGADSGPCADDSLTPLAAPLALEGRALSHACARFNRLALEERAAFFALVLDAAAPDRLARAQGLSLSELARRARRALALFRGAGLVPARGERSA